MKPIDGQPILTAAQMHAAEDRAIAAGTTVQSLMERAGAGVAEAVRRLAAGSPVLVLCGPGNNGGDGYVAARVLRANGVEVRVAALGEPRTEAAAAARAAWGGEIEALDTPFAAPIVVDAIFGTGLRRPLDDEVAQALGRMGKEARLSIAVDVPSHVATDTGEIFNEDRISPVDLTLALGALKPAHILMPATEYCGTVRLIDIGVDPRSVPYDDQLPTLIQRPEFLLPDRSSHKYSRGLVVVIGGNMAGAARLAAIAAARAGAGYVILFEDGLSTDHHLPDAIVRRTWSGEALESVISGKRNVVLVVGPGLGRDDAARLKLRCAIAAGQSLIVDGDALHLLDDAAFADFAERDWADSVTLTPHGSEFEAAFGKWSGNKIDAARSAAARAGASVVFKGPDTVIAGRDGSVTVMSSGSKWLSTAGSGDVLAGAIAGAICSIATCEEDAAAAVWMHAEAARRLGGAFIADDLARELGAVRAAL